MNRGRYTFEEPIAALFEIAEIDDHTVSTAKGEAKILNISLHGIKLNTQLLIPEIDHKSINLIISFELNDRLIHVNGVNILIKNKVISFDYGIDLIFDESTEKELIEQLKVYSRKFHHLED